MPENYTPLNAPGSLNFWIGGAGDYNEIPGYGTTGLMGAVMGGYIRAFGGRPVQLNNILKAGSGNEALNVYTGYANEEEILVALVQYVLQYPNTRVNIIGHSWGGPVGMRIMEAIKAWGIEGNILLTLDPVGYFSIVEPTNQKLWLNTFVTQTSLTVGNVAARIGGQLGFIKGAENLGPNPNYTHEQARLLFEYLANSRNGIKGNALPVRPSPPIYSGGANQSGNNGDTNDLQNDQSWSDFSEEEGEDPEAWGDSNSEELRGDQTSPPGAEESGPTSHEEHAGESFAGSEDYSNPGDGMESVSFEGALGDMVAYEDLYDPSEGVSA